MINRLIGLVGLHCPAVMRLWEIQ